MHATTVKEQLTFAHSRATNKLFHIGRYFRRFIVRYRVIYRPIFQISAIFCCKRYGERFSHIVSASGKKRRYRPTRTIFRTWLLSTSDYAWNWRVTRGKKWWGIYLIVGMYTLSSLSNYKSYTRKAREKFSVKLEVYSQSYTAWPLCKEAANDAFPY